MAYVCRERRKKLVLQSVLIILVMIVVMMNRRTHAGGPLDPTNAPGPTMHSLEEIYQHTQSLLPLMSPQAITATTIVIQAGYYATTDLTTIEIDLTNSNIRSGVAVFGVSGNSNVVDTRTASAVASDILSGKTAYVGGVLVTGNVPVRTSVIGVPGNPTIAIPDGFYSGLQTATAQDPDLLAGNIITGVVIFGVMGAAVIAIGDAVADDVVFGRTFSSASGVGLVGSMVDQEGRGYLPGTSDVPIAAGYYDGSGIISGDVNLVGFNIKTNVTIFGVVGSAGPAPAPVQKTGQTNSYFADDDGALQLGVTEPVPRFTIGADTNVVTDNLTGLMRARDAGIFFRIAGWTNAVAACTNLVYGGYDDWRLPNVREMFSLIDFNNDLYIKLPDGHPFANVIEGDYWTSSIYARDPVPDPPTTDGYAWAVGMMDGDVYFYSRRNSSGVWPVRGP